MTKYHIGSNGPKECTALKRDCPLGENTPHFSSEKEAESYWQESLIETHGETHTAKKKVSLSKEELKDKVTQTQKELNDFVAKSIALEEKQKSLIAKIKQSDPSSVPESAYVQLEKYEEQAKKAHLKEGKLFRNFKIAEKRAFEAGVIAKVTEENAFKARGTKWADNLGIGYHADVNVTLRIDKSMTSKRRDSLVAEYAAWSGKSIYEARDRLNAIYKETKNSQYTFDQLVTKEFQDTAGKDKKKNKIFIDLETTSLDPYRGEIIEVGIVVVDPTGKVIQTHNERYDMEETEAREELGTGPVFVHKIEPEDIKGKPKFSDPHVQKQLKTILNDKNSIIIPHNAGFEHGQLSTHLEGYYSSHVKDSAAALRQRKTVKDSGKPEVLTQDTRALSAYFLKSEKNTLKEFATANGITAEEYDTTAHGAYADADMTSRAYAQFKENLKNMPEGEKYISPHYNK